MKNKEMINIVDVQTKEKNDDVSLPIDPRSSIRKGLLILLVGFGGFLSWAIFANLDEGVPAVGTIVVDSKRKIIQHPAGGIIEAVLVRDCEKVKEGQVLMRLISTQSRANLVISQNQAALLKIQLTSLKPLVDEGYYPRNQYLDLKRQYDDAMAKVKVAQEESDRTEIKAPVAGTVMGLSINTIGGVITPGGKVMEVVPEGDRLVVEAQIPPHLIDKIHSGLIADVHFSALNQRTTPVMTGQVEWVSADRFQDPNRPELAYYSARIQLTEETVGALKGELLVAGMPADVVIKTGSRSFWSYLVKPIADRAALSMKER